MTYLSLKIEDKNINNKNSPNHGEIENKKIINAITASKPNMTPIIT